jgi:hypothetical protein
MKREGAEYVVELLEEVFDDNERLVGMLVVIITEILLNRGLSPDDIERLILSEFKNELDANRIVGELKVN